MIRLLGLAGAALCCVFLTTCGTVRAIQDDYAEDYIIRDISPLSGVSGAQVTFQAAICATAGSRALDDPDNPPQIIWNFGGGADPNVSYDLKPVVTLRAGRSDTYEGTLSIRDGCTDENLVTATFSLKVAPLIVLDVAPLSGVENATAVFSAVIGTGSVTEYVWDFGERARRAAQT